MAEILIVEDDQAVRDAFTRTLRHGGFHVTTAENGVAALQVLGQQTFDAIISDYRMPELGGQGFYEQLEERFPSMRSEERRVGKSVDLGGRRIIKKKKKNRKNKKKKK